jgi:hypothetical protein
MKINYLIILIFLSSCKVKEGSYSADNNCVDPQSCFDKIASCDASQKLGGQETGTHFLPFSNNDFYSAQEFSLNEDKLIFSISVGLAQSGSPTGSAYLEIRESCQDNSSNRIPCEDYLIRSSSIKMNTFSISTPIENQEFIFTEPIILKKDTSYWLVTKFPLSGQTGKQIFQYAQTGDPLSEFRYLYKNSSPANWDSSWNTYDAVFLINECLPGLD